MIPLCEMFGVCFLLIWFIGGFVSVWLTRKYVLDKDDEIPKLDLFMGHIVAFILSWVHVFIILNEKTNGVF